MTFDRRPINLCISQSIERHTRLSIIDLQTPHLVARLLVGPAPQQQVHRCRAPVLARAVERGQAAVVLRLLVRAVPQQNGHRRCLAQRGRQVQGGLAQLD